MSEKSLLLVDDEPALLELLKRFLERHGHSVHACTDPAEALQLVQAAPSRFDLIVSDLVLPGMNGEEMIERMRAFNPRLPAVLASGYPHRTRLPEVEFLQKPFLPTILLEVIDRLLTAPQSPSSGASASETPAAKPGPVT
jgi:CheY-like chemotaxis protein